MNSMFESSLAMRPDNSMFRRWQEEDARARDARGRSRYFEDLGIQREQRDFDESGRRFDDRLNVLRSLMQDGGGYEALPARPQASMGSGGDGAMFMGYPGRPMPQGDGIDRRRVNNVLARYLLAQMGGDYGR